MLINAVDVDSLTIESLPIAGIALAIVAAALLAVGNELQARGVNAVSKRSADSAGLGAKQFRALFRSGVWLLGTLSLGLAVLVQLASLTLAPLIVVQPVGVAALVFAALLTAWSTHRMPTRRVVRSILICIGGVGVFVTVAALVAKQHAIRDAELIAILVVLGVVFLALATVFVLYRFRWHRPVAPIVYVLAGGVLTGFVATLGKTVILRVQTVLSTEFVFDSATVLTGLCVLGLLAAGGLSIYFVQMSHTGNRPEVVVAGLTVIDPFVAVILGVTILGEAAGAPLWALAAFVLAGATAVAGVFLLSAAQRKDDRLNEAVANG
jgi:drug/metabolite transporter (DMT)-like permease